MVNRLTVTLEQTEYTALLEMAISELRDPPDQLRYILRQELCRRGWLALEPSHVDAEHDRGQSQIQDKG
jgi:hypothetical protein